MKKKLLTTLCVISSLIIAEQKPTSKEKLAKTKKAMALEKQTTQKKVAAKKIETKTQEKLTAQLKKEEKNPEKTKPQLQENSLEKKLKEGQEAVLEEKKNTLATLDKNTANKETPPRSITLKNNISEKTITYDGHWAKPFPTTFYATINGEEYLTLSKKGKLQLKESKISALCNKVHVAYEWAIKKWGKVWHHEHKELEFEVPEKIEEFNISFCWDNDNRIDISNATMIKCITLPSSST